MVDDATARAFLFIGHTLGFADTAMIRAIANTLAGHVSARLPDMPPGEARDAVAGALAAYQPTAQA